MCRGSTAGHRAVYYAESTAYARAERRDDRDAGNQNQSEHHGIFHGRGAVLFDQKPGNRREYVSHRVSAPEKSGEQAELSALHSRLLPKPNLGDEPTKVKTHGVFENHDESNDNHVAGTGVCKGVGFESSRLASANDPDQGEASCRTHDANGLAVWTLRIGKQEIPGRWIIVDREFKPAQ